jgi:hypothetical protein
MTNSGPAHASASSHPVPKPANDDDERPEATSPKAGSVTDVPANDNPASDDLPACLLVTEEEVRILQRYLGQQILGLFS